MADTLLYSVGWCQIKFLQFKYSCTSSNICLIHLSQSGGSQYVELFLRPFCGGTYKSNFRGQQKKKLN